MPSQHWTLGPSGAPKWTLCAASVRLELGKPDSSSEYAALGTAAHELLETCFNNVDVPEGYRDVPFGKCEEYPDGFIADDNMIKAVETALVFVNDTVKSLGPDTVLYPERKLDPGEWMGRDDMKGTGDITIVSATELHVYDYKHGQGIVVEINNNLQLLLYLIGALADLPPNILNRMEKLVIGIIQPRAFHAAGPIRTQEIHLKDIPTWVDFFTRCANATDDPNAVPFPGTAQCRWCKAKPCAVMVNTVSSNLELTSTIASQYVTPEQTKRMSEEIEQNIEIDVDQLTASQRVAWLENADMLRAFLDAVESQATQDLIKGVAAPEIAAAYKIVEGKSNRKFVEDETIDLPKKLKGMGFKKDEIFTEKLRTPTQIIKLAEIAKFTKQKMTNLLGLIIKPKGKMTMVPMADNRPPFRPTTAEGMFGKPLDIKEDDEQSTDSTTNG